jgi:hypothetical protein
LDYFVMDKISYGFGETSGALNSLVVLDCGGCDTAFEPGVPLDHDGSLLMVLRSFPKRRRASLAAAVQDAGAPL